jgi:hypothetical protein
MQPNRQVQRKPRKPSACHGASRGSASEPQQPTARTGRLGWPPATTAFDLSTTGAARALWPEDELAEVPRSLATSLKAAADAVADFRVGSTPTLWPADRRVRC